MRRNIRLRATLGCVLLGFIQIIPSIGVTQAARAIGNEAHSSIWRQAKRNGSQEPNQKTETSPNAAAETGSSEPMSLKRAFLNIPSDQKAIWAAPLRLRAHDFSWLIPVATTTGVLIASDQRNMSREHSSANAIKLSKNISNAGTIALGALPASMYVWGTLHGLGRARETGLLTGEALINSFIVGQGLKTALGRERPTSTDGHGNFFQQFANPSFPSDHSMLSWTAASVIAHEYPGVLSQSLVYATAGAVSISRVTAREHFPSDVVVGGALGWIIGRQIYRAHHNTDLDDSMFGSFMPESGHFDAPQTGTTYVSIDSWVYPAFERLMALGYLPSGEAGMRPWTRTECARLVAEAETAIDPEAHDLSAATVRELAIEFDPELEGHENRPDTRLEEIYARVGFLGGEPLVDDYHFAKTITNDYGRPFGRGANAIAGASTRATVGPFAFYVRGEYQEAGDLPPESAGAQLAIANLEGLPFAPPQRTDSISRLRLLDSYISFSFRKNVISFGKQTLWWGPGADGPFLASNNAEPIPMLRISRASPFTLPWLFGLMGPIRAELFWGQLDGQQFVSLIDAGGNRRVISAPLHPHPAIQGAKFSFKPTKNLEFGFDETAIYSGPGFPLTVHSLLRSYSPGNTLPGVAADPGDRRSGFDFSYRLPGLRNWLTLYSDSFTEDEFSPISFPRKSSFRAGLYAPRLPGVPNADLRVEGIYTDIPNLGGPGVEYFNTHYLSGYTNYGQIIGNAIGREGRGLNTWGTYRFTPRNTLHLHYRNQRVNPEFLEGGYLRDYDVGGTFAPIHNVIISGTLKYEHWGFPLLSPLPKTNVSAAVQISFHPESAISLWNRK